jgi:hypothetical protein
MGRRPTAHPINRRQKPIWQQIRKPLPSAGKSHSIKKGKHGYDRKDRIWKKETGQERS